MEVYTLSNTGAYGEHGPTTVGLTGEKPIPLYTGGLEAHRFSFDVVYTNLQAAGAYRGYGATQGIFAVESAVNELAEKLGMDPTVIREKNMVRQGMVMPAYHGWTANACALDRCMAHCRQMFNWEEKYPVRDMGNGKVRTAGVAMAMQGSRIADLDVGSATVKLSDDGTYNLIIGAADMGTGCDTILAQMVAEAMDCELDDVAVFSADTDLSPYDSGSYASSTTYLTGKAVEKACTQLKARICEIAAGMLGCEPGELTVEGREAKTEDGTYNLIIGAADMGTGCDTILAQMVAELMDCHVDDIAVFGADTDVSPYDSGSYASSTTYITGQAVVKACNELKKRICAIAAQMLNCEEDAVVFESNRVRKINTEETVSLMEIAYKSQVGNTIAAESTATHSSPVSPPPFMVGMVEIELDKLTGKVDIIDYMAVVDCGIPINPALATIQTEGGIVQGIGHTLMENVTYDHSGRPAESSFMQYKVPTRLDMGRLKVEFEHSYEPTGPFGAKSIGEIVINTPGPAIAHAIYRATGKWFRELPITPEQIAMSMIEE
jgi:CO/xanthine dehydrogenase Mo-binding subunit